MVEIKRDQRTKMWRADLHDQAHAVIYAESVHDILVVLDRCKIPRSDARITWTVQEWERQNGR